MMLTVSMTVSHLYQNLENIKIAFNVFQVLIRWLTVIKAVSIIKTLKLAMF